MGHPFVVGGRYRNRDGEYTVIKLDGSNMLIQYADGRMIETQIARQERIWENMQFEVEVEEETPISQSVPPSKSSRQVKDRYGKDFRGLTDADFKSSTEGTSWRARTSLGGLLALRLSTLSEREFESHAIYRRTEVHIVQPQSYNPEIRLQEAKFFFLVNAEGVRHGFYIEKNWDEMDNTWDWHRFTASLMQRPSVWHQLTQTMGLHKLRWEAYIKTEGQEPGRTIYVDVRADQLSLRDSQNGPLQIVDWSDFARLMDGIRQTEWCNLYLVQQIEKHEAIQLGVRIADRVRRGMEFACASISCHCAALFTLTLLAFWSTKGSAEWIWLAPKSGPRANVIRACKIKAMAALQL